MTCQPLFTQSKSQPKVEFPMCYHYAFKHLKAQATSNGKTMSHFWFSCHSNIYHCVFNHLKAQKSSNGNTMPGILLIYTTDHCASSDSRTTLPYGSWTLTGCPQMVKVGNNISTSLTLNTGAQKDVCSAVSCTPCSPTTAWPCTPPTQSSKSADSTPIVGLITNNNETAYREEVRALRVWCQENNLSLNVYKTKEMIMAFRKQQREHPPIHIEGTAVEKVECFKFLGVHITD